MFLFQNVFQSIIFSLIFFLLLYVFFYFIIDWMTKTGIVQHGFFFLKITFLFEIDQAI